MTTLKMATTINGVVFSYHFSDAFRSLSPDVAGVKNGCLLFLLKKKQWARKDEEIAETVLPLEELSVVDTMPAQNVDTKFLYMNIPRKEEGMCIIIYYRPLLNVLRFMLCQKGNGWYSGLVFERINFEIEWSSRLIKPLFLR